MTELDSTATDVRNEVTATPPDSPSQALSTVEQPKACPSPPGDTQALSQFVYPPRAFADEVEDEAAEGVWGYLIPLDDKVRDALVLRKRHSCDARKNGDSKTQPSKGSQHSQDKSLISRQRPNQPPGGYLVGRHPECGGCLQSAIAPFLKILTAFRPGYQYSHNIQSAFLNIQRKQERRFCRNCGRSVQQWHLC